MGGENPTLHGGRDEETEIERLDRNWIELLRGLFRQHERAVQVSAGHHLAQAGIATLGLAVTGVVVLIFDTVLGGTAAVVAVVASLALFGGLWGALPWVSHRVK